MRMNDSGSNGKWILQPAPDRDRPYRLFCFPFAGGGASPYYRWPRMLPEEIGVYAVRPPGRENRILEKPFTRLPALITELARVLMPHLDKPFAFYGHSMGALIGFELAHYLNRKFSKGPVHLFVAAGRAPHLVNLEPPYYDQPEAHLLEKLKRYNGLPAQILKNADLMAFVLPCLRADLELLQTYTCADRPPLACPITAFGGTTDRMVARHHLEAWQPYTQKTFVLRMFQSGHFFSTAGEHQLLQVMASDLTATMEEI